MRSGPGRGRRSSPPAARRRATSALGHGGRRGARRHDRLVLLRAAARRSRRATRSPRCPARRRPATRAIGMPGLRPRSPRSCRDGRLASRASSDRAPLPLALSLPLPFGAVAVAVAVAVASGRCRRAVALPAAPVPRRRRLADQAGRAAVRVVLVSVAPAGPARVGHGDGEAARVVHEQVVVDREDELARFPRASWAGADLHPWAVPDAADEPPRGRAGEAESRRRSSASCSTGRSRSARAGPRLRTGTRPRRP